MDKNELIQPGGTIKDMYHGFDFDEAAALVKNCKDAMIESFNSLSEEEQAGMLRSTFKKVFDKLSYLDDNTAQGGRGVINDIRPDTEDPFSLITKGENIMKASEKVAKILDKYPEIPEEDKKVFIESFELLEDESVSVPKDMQILHSAPHYLFSLTDESESDTIPKAAQDEIAAVLSEVLSGTYKNLSDSDQILLDNLRTALDKIKIPDDHKERFVGIIENGLKQSHDRREELLMMQLINAAPYILGSYYHGVLPGYDMNGDGITDTLLALERIRYAHLPISAGVSESIFDRVISSNEQPSPELEDYKITADLDCALKGRPFYETEFDGTLLPLPDAGVSITEVTGYATRKLAEHFKLILMGHESPKVYNYKDAFTPEKCMNPKRAPFITDDERKYQDEYARYKKMCDAAGTTPKRFHQFIADKKK